MFLENTLNFDKQTGWIEVVCGSMFSGKTEELIRRIRRAKYANLSVIIFKPKVVPIAPPNKIQITTGIKFEVLGCRIKVLTAVSIPNIPKILPLRAVSGDDNPFKANIKKTEEIK